MYVYKKKIYLLAFSLIDLIGNILFLPFRKKDEGRKIQSKRILIIRVDHIGDVVSATAILGPLRKAYPEAVIDFLVPSWASDVLQNNPYLSHILQFDPPWFDRGRSMFGAGIRGIREMIRIIRKGEYDLVIDLRGDVRHIAAMFIAGIKNRISYGITGGGFLLTHQVPYRKDMHEIDRNLDLLRPLGIEEVTSRAEFYCSENDKEKTERLKKEAGICDKYAVMHMVPGHFSKTWNVEKFREVAQYISKEKGLQVVMVGSSKDKPSIGDMAKGQKDLQIIDLSGRTSIGVLGGILREAALFVGVDSGPSHIAAAVNIRSVLLFSGANDPGEWAPRNERMKIVYPGKDKDLSEVSSGEVCGTIDEVMEL